MKFLTAQAKGQTLVVILLGTSVALTVALAVSVRTISTLKQTTTSAQAQAALAAAEAGAEVALNNIKSGTCVYNAGTGTVSGAGCAVAEASAVPLTTSSTLYWFTINSLGGTDPYLMDLASDVTQEVKLDSGLNGKTAKVCWWDQNLDGAETTNAVEIIYVDGAGNMQKFAYNGTPAPNTGFSSPGSHNVPVTFPSSGKTVTFKNCQDVPPAAMSNPKILRLKAFYANFSAVVVPNSGGTLSGQGYQILSYGKTSDGSVRKAVRVTKSLPSLPAIFDYAIYSGSTTQPLSK